MIDAFDVARCILKTGHFWRGFKRYQQGKSLPLDNVEAFEELDPDFCMDQYWAPLEAV